MFKAKVIWICALLLLALPALAQKASKIPILNSVSPSTTTGGGGAFILTATGSKFTSGSVVRWNGNARSSTYISSTQLQGVIGSLDIQTAGTAKVTVYTPGRSGGESASVAFTIATPTTTTTEPPPPPPPSPTPLSITTTSVPGGTAGTDYKASVAASGGSPSYVWSTASGGGSLPPGLALQADGTIAGTPTQGGTFSFTTQASDQASQVAQKVLSITVAAPATTTTPTGFLFLDDFESGTFSKWMPTALWKSMNPAITSAVTRNGSKYAYEQYYYVCGDSTNPACGGSSQDVNRSIYRTFDSTNGFPAGLDPIYVRGYFKGHLNPGGGDGVLFQRKLLYITDLTNGSWNVSVILTSDGRHFRVQNSYTGSNACGATGPLSYDHNQLTTGGRYMNPPQWQWDTWYAIELAIGMNTPGQSNGWIKFWVDGVQYLNVSGLNLRGTCTNGWKSVAVGEQTNRVRYEVTDEYRHWDDVVISTAGPIGP